MIDVVHIINAAGRGSLQKMKFTSTHKVKVTVTGKSDLARLATYFEAEGNRMLAAQIKRAKQFSISMPAEEWRAIAKGAA